MIPFNKPYFDNDINNLVMDSMLNRTSGDGKYTKLINEFFKNKFNITNMLMTTSCSSALELAMILLDIKDGDEVIMPSFTFTSTANCVVLRGGRPVFCDIDSNTMNIDANKIECLITDKTKAILVVHYAGVLCDMDKIMDIAHKHNLYVVEDAAQAIGSLYKNEYYAGTIGDIGCYSFHETKNFSMGEGGAIVIKDNDLFHKAEIIREKGTNRSEFLRGVVDKYTWVNMGSSLLPSDILSAYLYSQLLKYDEISSSRINIWNTYYDRLIKRNDIKVMSVPKYSSLNAHIFYIIVKDNDLREKVIKKMKDKGIIVSSHYEPLHSSTMGKQFKSGNMEVTDLLSSRMVRLPLYYGLSSDEVSLILDTLECVLDE